MIKGKKLNLNSSSKSINQSINNKITKLSPNIEIKVDNVSQKKSFSKTTGEFLKERAVSTDQKDYCLSIVIAWSEGNCTNKNN